MEKTLTEREYAISLLVIEGMTNNQIANELQISIGTVNNYVANKIFKKLEITNRHQLAAIFAQNPPKRFNRSTNSFDYEAKFLEKCTEPMTVRQAMALIGCSKPTALKYLKQYNLLVSA